MGLQCGLRQSRAINHEALPVILNTTIEQIEGVQSQWTRMMKDSKSCQEKWMKRSWEIFTQRRGDLRETMLGIHLFEVLSWGRHIRFIFISLYRVELGPGVEVKGKLGFLKKEFSYNQR